ncbi:hypothetical protein ACP70R_030051 [Stipagrostis hirtigluma subsp. patula]
MNPPSRSGPHGELNRCEGNGCASAAGTWPLYQVYRRGVRCRLCSSCILLSNRALYCCCCFLLLARASPSHGPHYDDGDPLIAPPVPTATCVVCRAAAAHLACLYPADVGAFVCPACRAASEGRPFSCAPPCGTPVEWRGARVLLLAARMAVAMLRQEAAMARAEAERLTREAAAARRRAFDALGVLVSLGSNEPSWNMAIPPELLPTRQNRLAPGGSAANTGGMSALVQRYAPPPPPPRALTIGGCSLNSAMAPTEAAMPTLAPPETLPLFGVNEAAVSAAEATMPSAAPPRPLQSLGVTELAAAAAEAARASPTPPQTLQLFPTRATQRRPKRKAPVDREM